MRDSLYDQFFMANGKEEDTGFRHDLGCFLACLCVYSLPLCLAKKGLIMIMRF